MELPGKVAIVTGGAVRLGRAMALALADAGVNIAVHFGRSADAAAETVDEIRACGMDAISVPADLRNAVQAAHDVVDRTVREFGRVDILVNSAAIFEADLLATATEERWDRQFAINLKSPFFLCQAFAERHAQGMPGHIVNIADRRATRPDCGYLSYTLTKVALVTMTKCLALELAPDIQVNAIAPGPILAPPGQPPDYLEAVARRIPLRRPGTPADVCEALLYLLRSNFITGDILHVAGGEQLPQ